MLHASGVKSLLLSHLAPDVESQEDAVRNPFARPTQARSPSPATRSASPSGSEWEILADSAARLQSGPSPPKVIKPADRLGFQSRFIS